MKTFNYNYNFPKSVTEIPIRSRKHGLTVPPDFEKAIVRIIMGRYSDFDKKIIAKYKVLHKAPVISWIEQVMIYMKRDINLGMSEWVSLVNNIKVLDLP